MVVVAFAVVVQVLVVVAVAFVCTVSQRIDFTLGLGAASVAAALAPGWSLESLIVGARQNGPPHQ